jgi:UDP-N-acetylmuramoyl-tripeptide--D-alanyl-D-alanine ligase
MSTPGEIAARCTLARPDAAIITTVAEAHFGGLGSLEAIAAEKASIAAGVPSGGIVVVPQGLSVLDAALAATGTPARIVRVGPTSDARLSEVRPGIDQTKFMLDGRSYQIPLPGAHNASNAALTVVLARWLGVPDDAIARGLAAATPAPMRLQRVTIATDPAITLINDAYNANPDSMLAALRTLRAVAPAGSRRVAVLGDMLEMGAEGPGAHRDIADAVAHERLATAAILVGPLAGLMAEPLARVGIHATTLDSAEGDNALAAAGLLREGDTVLLKGSRGVGLERILAALRGRAASPTPGGIA